jgi:hypothetical protein
VFPEWTPVPITLSTLVYADAGEGFAYSIHRDMKTCKNCIHRFYILLLLILMGSPSESFFCRPSAEEGRQREYKRLILKDGSYELISQYEIQGGRVRYFSTERDEWEELPNALIDWDATAEYADQHAQRASAKTKEALEASAERNEDARTPTVMPGLKLPLPEGVFLLDIYQGRPELNRLIQNGTDINKNMGRNILRGVLNPVAGSRQTIELEGQHAAIQSHVLNPSIYVAVDAGDPSKGYTAQTAFNHLRIVRCEEKNGNRIVAVSNIAIYGKVEQSAQYIDAKVEPVSDYWVKVIPAATLQTGEYALVEFDERGSMNLLVWDFGVNPQAPDNPEIFPSIPKKEEPVLIQKSRKP